MIDNIENKLMGLDKFQDVNVGWDTYFYKRANNPHDITWYDLSFNYNSPMYNTDTCIILTSYYKHLIWMKHSLQQYRKTGAFVVVGYDNPFRAYDDSPYFYNLNNVFPRREHFLAAHCFVIKHPTYDNNKRFGSFWDTRYAQAIMNSFDFKYVILGTTDCAYDRPEGMEELKAILGDGDFMACASSSTPNSTGTIHTSNMIFKKDAFNKVLEHMSNHFKVPLIGHMCKNFETMMRDAVQLYKLKETIAPKQPIYPKDGTVDMYSCYNQESTWKEVLGFHNLFAEFVTASEERLEPPDKKYIDDYDNYFYFDEGDKNMIGQYYKTQDRRYLYQWWGKYSLTKSEYFPIEYYGKEPIYGINKS